MSNLLDKSSIVLTPTAYDNSKVLCVKPSDGSGDFDFSRNSAATRVNAQGLVENVQILSSNLVQNGDFSEQGAEEVSNGSFSQEGVQLITNGDFATDTDWVKGTGWSISGGSANCDGTQASNSLIYQNIGSQANKTVKFSFTVTNYVSGVLETAFFGAAGTIAETISANGDYTFYINVQSGHNGNTGFTAKVGFTGSIDNVSVREVGQDWTLGGEVTIGDNLAHFESNTNTYSYIRQDISSLTTKTYKIQLEVKNYVSGEVQVLFKGSPSALQVLNVSSDGVYTAYLTPNANGDDLEVSREFNGGNFNFDITNISVKEVGMDWTLDDWSVGNSLVSSGNTSSLLRQDNIYTSTTSIYKTTFKAKSVNGTSVTLRVYDGSGNNFETITITSSDFQDFTLTRQRQGASPSLFFFNNSNAEIEITNISVIEISTDTNLPRINYEGFSFDGSGNIIPNSGCGSWLFEPQSTNLVPYSEDFSQWSTKTNISVTLNSAISPEGVNSAAFINENSSNAQHFIGQSFSFTNGQDVTISVYAKKNQRDVLQISPSGNYLSTSGYANYDLTNGLVTASGGGVTAEIETLTNDWYRCIAKFTANNSATGTTAFFLQNSTTASRGASYQGDGTSGLYLWGAQVEALSYPTSLIPTSGSSVTRNQDVCTNGGSLATINSTEGTLYAEIKALANDLSFRSIGLSDGTANNRILILYTDASNGIRVLIFRNNLLQVILNHTINITDVNKVAVRYKFNDVTFWVNGVKLSTDTNAFMPIGLNQLSFSRGDGDLPFFGKTKCLAVFPYLTDAELTELTTI